MDVKIKNGDVAVDSCGNFIYIDGAQEMLQRALICINTFRGGFIYNKELGCERMESVDSAVDIRRLEARMREAIANLSGVLLEVENAQQTDTGLCVDIALTYKEETIRAEVIY